MLLFCNVNVSKCQIPLFSDEQTGAVGGATRNQTGYWKGTSCLLRSNIA